MTRTMPKIPLRKTPVRKPPFNKFGLGAIALYAVGLVAAVLGVYGINLSSVMNKWNESDRLRTQAQNGRMLIGTADRTQCRAVRFDNHTSQITGESLVECTDRRATDNVSPEASFSVFSKGFNNR
jgi:hypothetical protein